MKRILTAGLVLVAACSLAGATAGSAPAAYHCLHPEYLGQYDEDGGVGEECKGYLVIPWFFRWDLLETKGKSVATGEICALVDTGEASLFNGPNCGSTEEEKGESKYEIAFEQGTGSWMSGGSPISGEAALATTAATDKTSVLSGGGLNIECKGALELASPEIMAAANVVRSLALTFTGCTTTSPACTVPVTIGTTPVQATTASEGALAAKATFKPVVGTLFATIKVSGAECSSAGTKPVTGDVNTSFPTAHDERTLQLLEVNVTAAQKLLFIGSAAASLTGSALLRLASGTPWSFL